VIEELRGRADLLRRMPALLMQTQETISALGRTVQTVHGEGGLLAAGSGAASSAPYGLGLHIELEQFVKSGLSPSQALQTATRNAADALGVLDELGTIERGKLADLIIVDRDVLTCPVDEVRDVKVLKTIVNGKVGPEPACPRDCLVDIALRWGSGYDTVLRSFVNIIATHKGGTHQSGFERGLVRTVNEQLRTTKLLKANDDAVIKDDVLEGLTAVVTVRLAEPQFEGQTKEILGTSPATRIVSHVVHRELTRVLSSSK
jgi:hypothetical protein